MTRPQPAALGGFLILIWAVLSAALLAKGGLYVGKHEGDTMHLVQIVLRIADGQWPHLDFMTPIGWLAAAPIALFVAQGMGVGMSILASEVLVAGVMLPAIWWVGVSRLGRGWAQLFGVIVIGLVLALIHGEAERSVSISMHYNRWAWAAAFLAIAVAVLPVTGMRSAVADGLILGLAVAVMALIKVTYVAAIFPVILLALVLRREFPAIGVALVSGLVVVAAITAFAGIGFWTAYIGDLMEVQGSSTRARPGDSFSAIVAAPAYLGGSMVALAGVILLRQAGRQIEGLLLMLLLPGFFFVTYQNFGNDPQWLYFLGILLFALRPEEGTQNSAGWNMRQALALAGMGAFMLGFPSAANLGFSPFRHLATDVSGYQPLFPRSEIHADLQVAQLRVLSVEGHVPLAGFPAHKNGEEKEPTLIRGETLPECSLRSGTVNYFETITRSLEEGGFAGSGILAADLFSPFWVFGDFRPLHRGSPWRYDGMPGVDDADYLLVPFCPVTDPARRAVVEQALAENRLGEEVQRTETYLLFRLQRP